ncbi:hypothetical protein [Candidatus Leptofilum sp.]|uniref:hypothetical protein n=1 Tax=Candidatus Leptofilum sp. TaxID=3241576 RepID=UPI003B5A2993
MPGPRTGPYPASPLPYIAAFLVRLDQQHRSMGQLRQYLVEHPALTWLLGFPLQQDSQAPHGFEVAAALPSPAHFSYVLRHLANPLLRFLLNDTVQLLRLALPTGSNFGQVVSLDTKHILAFVKENNPKAYIKEGRCDKDRQPVGDPDCKYGCKRRRNRAPEQTTPTKDGHPAPGLGVGKDEFYWGYASGVVATKVPGWGEFVLAEMTDTFDHADIHYFFPLMAIVEERLGFRPPYGTADAAYDAWYVYDYFHSAGGLAAVPYVDRTKGRTYSFDEAGLPFCAAGLPMPVKSSFMNRSSRVPHQRARHACPLFFPAQVAQQCPVNHKNWKKGGCISTLPTSMGARVRYQLDREGPEYKAIYKQRTAVERIFSQAVALGIERPKLRNQQSITNLNSLIYILINLRALQRVYQKKANGG